MWRTGSAEQTATTDRNYSPWGMNVVPTDSDDRYEGEIPFTVGDVAAGVEERRLRLDRV
jgi:hypothetical protein